MKKVNYEFVTGEVVEIEVSEEWAEVLKEMDRNEHNINQTETRRHCTLDVLGDEGEWMLDETTDPALIAEMRETMELVIGAIKSITPKQRDIIKRVAIEGMSIVDYAEKECISQPVASKRLKAAQKNIKKF